TVLPATDHKAATVTVLMRKKGSTGAFASAAKVGVTGGSFTVPVKLPPGSYELQTRFDDPGQVLSAVAPTSTVTVPGAATVKFSHIKVKGRDITVTGKLSPSPKASGAYVRLLVRKSGKGSYKAKGSKVSIGTGRTSFTIRTH